MERINSLLSIGQPTKEVLAQICVSTVFIRSVSDAIFAITFLPKPPRTSRLTAADHSLRNTDLRNKILGYRKMWVRIGSGREVVHKIRSAVFEGDSAA
jgi:hypothetical protein